MDEEHMQALEEDWETVIRMLPEGWREQARTLGALRRTREFPDADRLLRVLLIHLADGCSLRETSVRASEGGLASVSDVALLKRLRHSGEWFRWMALELMRTWGASLPQEILTGRLRVRVVDGSMISEPGRTGSQWRLHYSVGLPSLECDELYLTGQEVGESLKRFSVRPGQVILADRGYAHSAGIHHVAQFGGDLVARINLTNVPLYTVRNARRRVHRRTRVCHSQEPRCRRARPSQGPAGKRE